jgi:serine protease Do
MGVVEQLRENGKVNRGRIGVQIGEVSKDVAQAIGLPKAEGALVSGVEPDSPADKGGLQPGDVILKFDGKAITKWSDLPRVVGQTKPGTSAAVEVWRKGKSQSLKVTVAETKADTKKAAATPSKEEAGPATTVLGMSVVDVPADTQKKLRIKGGVLVKSVESPASSAGIAEGDIILTVNNTDVTGVDQFAKLVQGLDKSKAVGLLVRRGEQTQWVAVKPAK